MRIKITLQLRIFFSFFALLLVLQSISSYLFYQAALDKANSEAQSKLRAGHAIFTNEVMSRSRYQTTSVNTIARDWALRDAVGKMDETTIKSALSNHSSRVNANIAVVTDTNGKLIAEAGGTHFEVPNELQEALEQHDDSAFARIMMVDGKAYQLVFSPIRAPVKIGWVGMGFSINNELANYFYSLTSLHTSFAIVINGTTELLASTLHNKQTARSISQYASQQDNRTVSPFSLSNNQLLITTALLPDANNLNIRIVMHQSLNELLKQFESWWSDSLLLNLLGLLLTSGLAYLISRTVSEPVRRLVSAIANVSAGEYEQEIDVGSKDEIGTLATEFNNMTLAIAVREKEICYRADHDELTGLLNRQRFLESVSQTLIQAHTNQDIAVVMVVGINRLKEVNATLGHDIGDQLMQKISGCLQQSLPDSYLLARQGSEFAVLHVVKTYQDIHQSCDMIHNILDNTFSLDSIKLRPRMRIGTAVYPDHATEALTLLRFADIALNIAKEQSLPSVLYDCRYDRHSILRLSLMSDLHQAILDNQMVLYYQPKLNLSKGISSATIDQVECLVRWIHPTHGFIPPDDFIPLAEQTGSITALTDWVLRTAIAQASQWRRQGMQLKIAVNISAVDLLHGNLCESIPLLLQEHTLDTNWLTLEVTESAVLQDPVKAIATLNQLKALGITLSIDDYGTGYSSMAQLKKLPVHELKIDKSFVMQITEDEDDAIIVQSTIRLGHNMGLEVTAEGVESQQALQLLSEQGCNKAQGFFISKPLPIDEFSKWALQTNYYIASANPQPEPSLSSVK